MKRKRLAAALLSGALVSLTVCFCAALFLRFSGNLITLLGPVFGAAKKDVTQFAKIFGQLRTASPELPVVPSLLLGTAASCFVAYLRTRKRILSVLVGILLLLLLFIIALLLTKVNGIRFLYVLLSLLTLV